MTVEGNPLQGPTDALDGVLETGYDQLPDSLQRASVGGADTSDEHLLTSAVGALETIFQTGQVGSAGDDATFTEDERTGGDNIRTEVTVLPVTLGSDALEVRAMAHPNAPARSDEGALLVHSAPGVPPEARLTEATLTRAGQSTSWVIESTVAAAAGGEGQQQGPAVTIGAVRRSGPAPRG